MLQYKRLFMVEAVENSQQPNEIQTTIQIVLPY